MNILGLSAYSHDSAACLVQDGEIVAAAQEERFTRKKHDASFPAKAFTYCLQQGQIAAEDLDYIAFSGKPFIRFERVLKSYLAYAPMGLRSFLKVMPPWIKQKLWIKEQIAKETGFKGKIIFPEHHEAHAASAFFPSPFDDAAFLTIGGVGEWATTGYGFGGIEDGITILAEMLFPHSLGLLYSAFTGYTGFTVKSDEAKLMELAPYGEPKYRKLILSELMDLKEDGSFKLNMAYFDYCAGLTMTNAKFDELFGRPPRAPETELRELDIDIACSIQAVTETVVLQMAEHVYKQTGRKNLCLAGGVALNCVANGRVLRESSFDDIWIQPAAGGAGGALGAALLAWHQYLGNKKSVGAASDFQKGSYLGPEFTSQYVREYLDRENITYTELTETELTEKIADRIHNQQIVGWFQGRMEYGPRGLGNRSILGDVRSAKMQETINAKVKFRESFRPFASSVLKERAADYFQLDRESQYMLLAAPVNNEIRTKPSEEDYRLSGLEKLKEAPRSSIPAVTHVDYSAGVQTVDDRCNPRFHALIRAFDKKYGCGVILNTSFKVRGEPIVCNPEDAYRCFMATEMDCLVMGNFLIEKEMANIGKTDVEQLKSIEQEQVENNTW